ncbi:hypothetical protein GCM10027321_06810 [Massilia terrae]|uniref:Uncharacterized protein n=1 Tax=Massilia terrae TaxID=1811224 RepID=A0ABT2CSJ9_9BURK|nr:hypothetical protein [Massilia terrae]MCS0656958.1 hypothetical protein [Massilia terrae]
MDQTSAPNNGGLAIAEATDLRSDRVQREIVEHGILMREHGQTMSAIEYLRARDVAAHVICRVLLEPHRRRARP